MKNIIVLGLGTILFFGIGGALIIELFLDKSFTDVLKEGFSIPYQILLGIAYGTVSGIIALAVINSGFFKKEKEFYGNIFTNLDLTYPKIIFLSLCAGIGEEIFFRAAIQPLIGIWLTAIIFVFIHGYLNPANWRISVYGVLMVLIMAGIGYLYEYTGLYTVMTAHAVFDILLFREFISGKPFNSEN